MGSLATVHPVSLVHYVKSYPIIASWSLVLTMVLVLMPISWILGLVFKVLVLLVLGVPVYVFQASQAHCVKYLLLATLILVKMVALALSQEKITLVHVLHCSPAIHVKRPLIPVSILTVSITELV